MSTIKDGTYVIALPFEGGCITDTGEGRYLNLLPPGSLGEHAHKINVIFNKNRGAYSLQFTNSKKYLTWMNEPQINTKLVTGDKPRYFKIEQHEYYEDKYTLIAAEAKEYHVGPALERIYPPWIALLNLPEKQAWVIKKI